MATEQFNDLHRQSASAIHISIHASNPIHTRKTFHKLRQHQHITLGFKVGDET